MTPNNDDALVEAGMPERPCLNAIRDMSWHQQMRDAEKRCVPCLLCGGAAKITDAGSGAGYYISCSNSQSLHASKGCMLDGRRCGGSPYNVMDWWNRLHFRAALTAHRNYKGE